VHDRRPTGNSGVERTFDTRGETVVDQNAVTSNPEKDPSDWVTGDEPVTGPQQSYLTTLAQQAGEPVEVDGLTKAQASEKIDELKDKTGR
jgi:hypothetical protein